MDSLSVPLTSRVQDLAAPNLSTSSLKQARNMAQAKKAAMDFESVYLAQMLQPMFDTVEVDEGGDKKLGILAETPTLQDLVTGLNALGIGPRDMITILQAIKAAGALQADLEVL